MHKVVLLIFIFSSNWLFSQFDKVIVGKEYNPSKKELFSGFIGETKMGVFTADYAFYSKRKQELIIRQFHTADMALMDSKDIYSVIDEGYTNEPEEIYFQNNQFFLFSILESLRDNTTLLALEVFNENRDKISTQILDTIRDDEVQRIEESADKNGFIISKNLKFTQLTEQEITITKLSNQGKLDWTKTIKSPMALQNLRIEKIIFNGNGPIYLLCNYAFDIRTEQAIDDQQIANKYAIWAYDDESLFLKEFELRLKSKWVNGVELAFNKSNDLIVSGYFNETKNQAINGVFSLKIGANLKLKKTSWYRFEPEVFAKFEKLDEKKKIKELDDYYLKSLLVLEDGSFFSVGEQFYKYTERSYDPRTNVTTTTEHYNYNSIIISYFDSLGSHQWTDRIPKFQNTTNDFSYSSFIAGSGKENVYLFFNDTDKNQDVPLGNYNGYSSMFNNRRFVISYVRVNKDGVQKRANLLPTSNSFLLRARLSSQLESSAIYLITETNSSRSSAIMKVNLKN